MKLNSGALQIRQQLKKADISPYVADIETMKHRLELENCRKSTLVSYLSYLKLFAAWLVLFGGNLLFSEVTVDTVRTYLEFLKNDQELAPNTINGYLAAIRKMFHLLRDEELSKRAVPDLVVDEHMPKVPSVKQVVAMLKACATIREKLFLMILLTTGIRLVELVRLQFSDIRKEMSVIYISAEAKGRADGFVPLSNNVLELLTEYCREYNAAHPGHRLNADDFIFFNKNRSGHASTATMREIFIEIQKRAGLEEEHFRPHSMRHFFALQLYIQSKDLFLVKQLLRHRTLAATLKYLVMATSMDLRGKYANPGDIAFEKLQDPGENKEGGNGDGSAMRS